MKRSEIYSIIGLVITIGGTMINNTARDAVFVFFSNRDSIGWILLVISGFLTLYLFLSITIRKLFEREYNSRYSDVLQENKKLLLQNQKDREVFQSVIDFYSDKTRINFVILKRGFIIPKDSEGIKELAKTLYLYFEKDGIRIPDWKKYFAKEEYKEILNALDDYSFEVKKKNR